MCWCFVVVVVVLEVCVCEYVQEFNVDVVSASAAAVESLDG